MGRFYLTAITLPHHCMTYHQFQPLLPEFRLALAPAVQGQPDTDARASSHHSLAFLRHAVRIHRVCFHQQVYLLLLIVL